MAKKPKPFFSTHTEAWMKRQRVWKRDSFFGYAVMMLVQLQDILRSDSITPEARATAEDMLTLADALAFHLEKRIDP